MISKAEAATTNQATDPAVANREALGTVRVLAVALVGPPGAGKTALIDAKSGRGHIILFGMRPQYRAQSYRTFKLFFNALVYGL